MSCVVSISSASLSEYASAAIAKSRLKTNLSPGAGYVFQTDALFGISCLDCILHEKVTSSLEMYRQSDIKFGSGVFHVT